MSVTASELRANVYALLDSVLESGTPLEVERKGKRLRIIAVEPPSRLERLPSRPDVIKGDPDDLVGLDWSSEWRP